MDRILNRILCLFGFHWWGYHQGRLIQHGEVTLAEWRDCERCGAREILLEDGSWVRV